MTVQIVFNLSPVLEGLYLPVANLVAVDEAGELTHFIQRATAETMAPYGLECSPEISALLQKVSRLTPKAIEEKFRPQRARTAATLAQLWENPQAKPQVETYIHRSLDQFLCEATGLALPITLEADRRTLAKDVLLVYSGEECTPLLHFSKKESGIAYSLRIASKKTEYSIREHQIVPLTNTEPAWLLSGYTLLRVPGINGNMVKPFLQKDVVLIPADKTRVYFQQFIAKNARRTRIEAEGFTVQHDRELRGARLELMEHLMEKTWMFQPVFQYAGRDFPFGDSQKNFTAVHFSDQSEEGIAVRQILRNPEAEAEIVEFLISIGLVQQDRIFAPPGDGSFHALTQWIATHRAKLRQHGIEVTQPVIEGRTLALVTGKVAVQASVQGDWFDVHGEVQIGQFNIPFRDFVPWLRHNDPFFPLPDHTFFWIPEPWFARYSELSGLLQEDGPEGLRLAKPLFVTLQHAGLTVAGDGFPEIDPDTIDYTPSPLLQAELRPYQLRGVKWLIGHRQHGFGACLADDMGLGKTLQTIAVLLHAKEYRMTADILPPDQSSGQLDIFADHRETLRPLNSLLIMPASLVFNWQRELQRFAPSLFVYLHTGAKRMRDRRAIASHDVVLTTYHTAKQDLDLLSGIEWHYIVLDESQYIKNHRAEISKVVRALQGEHKISLSGTPIENSLADLWAQMEFINPDTLGEYTDFKSRFINPIEKKGDAVAKERLFQRVRPFFLRRTKEEVAPDLPPLAEQVFYCELAPEQRKRYEETKSAVRNEILALFDNPQTRLQALQALMRLRQLASHPLLTDETYKGGSGKYDDVLAQWDVLRRSNHKVLLFSAFEKHLRLFRNSFEQMGYSFAWLTGDTPTAARAAEVSRFQDDTAVQAFFMTIKAGGVGLNLTAADYVFLLDPWWNPAVEHQAIARAHRIGQTRPVTVIRFISRETIEEKILLLQERKRQLGEGLFNNESDFAALNREDLEELLR